MNECILDLMFGIPIETEGFVFVQDVHLKIFEKSFHVTSLVVGPNLRVWGRLGNFQDN